MGNGSRLLKKKMMNRKKDIEQLFRQHYAKMYNLARCILSDDDESKEIGRASCRERV